MELDLDARSLRQATPARTRAHRRAGRPCDATAPMTPARPPALPQPAEAHLPPQPLAMRPPAWRRWCSGVLDAWPALPCSMPAQGGWYV